MINTLIECRMSPSNIAAQHRGEEVDTIWGRGGWGWGWGGGGAGGSYDLSTETAQWVNTRGRWGQCGAGGQQQTKQGEGGGLLHCASSVTEYRNSQIGKNLSVTRYGWVNSLSLAFVRCGAGPGWGEGRDNIYGVVTRLSRWTPHRHDPDLRQWYVTNVASCKLN